jgi:DNA-binding NarL/FixJ family response regulator
VNVARELMLLVSHIARTDPGKQDASNDAEPREAARIPVYRDTIFQALSKLCTSVVCNSREIERLNAIITRLPSARAGDLATTRMLSSIDNGGPEVSVSRREREVLIQLFGGKTNREISRELGISEKTVKNHLWRIYRKLGVDNRTQLFHRLISA